MSKVSRLTADQKRALRELGEPYHYRVDWQHHLSPEEYKGLLSMGLITEAWTWASRARPDVAITDAGAAERAPRVSG